MHCRRLAAHPFRRSEFSADAHSSDNSRLDIKEIALAVKIRLARHGAKKYPYYRVVVADSRAPRDGRFICEVGRYNPNTNPKLVKLDLEAIDQWISNGAQPTDTVARLIEVARKEQAEAPKEA